MALTRDYKETILKRIQNDRKFAEALVHEALSAIAEGDYPTGLLICRDLIHAFVPIQQLSKETKIGEKSLLRMFGEHGNPTLKNFSRVFCVIQRESLKPKNHSRRKGLVEA